MGRAIFISYRRDDTEGEAGRLFDDLTRTFGESSVFMDVTGINPGLDFRKAIDDNVATCGVLLAMIGPTWATITDSSGKVRLDDANDFVRLEIASALARDIAVIPVLVHDAKMPHPDQLPDNLKDLAYRNSVEITHARWTSDVQLIIAALAQYVAVPGHTSDEPVHATVAVQLPPVNAPAHEAAPPKASKMPLIAGIAVAAVVAIAAIAFFALRGSAGTGASGNGAANNPVAITSPAAAQPPSSGKQTPGQAAPTNPLAGTWTNPSPEGKNGLKTLEISGVGNQLSIHARGECQPSDCDWGVQMATFDNQKATATWDFLRQGSKKEKGRVVTVTIKPGNAGLNVDIVNTFPNHPATQRQIEFERAQ
jgi:hypothetical protein